MRIDDVKLLMEEHGDTFIDYDNRRHYVIFKDKDGYVHSQSVYHYGKFATSIVARAIPSQYLVENLKRICKDRGLEYLCHTGVGGGIRIRYVCSECGYEGNTKYNHIQQGHGCPRCANNLRRSLEEVRRCFAERGYELLIESYVNAHTPLLYKCSKHPEKIRRITWNNFEQGKGCPECAIRRGEANNRWLGGVTPIYNYLRNQLKWWKSESLRASNGRCAVSGKELDERYVVHHLKSFNLIFREIFEETGIELKPELSDYSASEIRQLSRVNRRKHKELLGVVLDPDVHELFHKLYGKGENTPEQFYEFKQRYQAGEFDACYWTRQDGRRLGCIGFETIQVNIAGGGSKLWTSSALSGSRKRMAGGRRR